MNTENEKRWFVYIGDHHEGPLSVQEVFERKQKGLVLPESYVWREGMADWLMLSQVQELTQALEAMIPIRTPEAASTPSDSETQGSESVNPAAQSTETQTPEPKSEEKSEPLPLPNESKKGSGILKKMAVGLIATVGLLVVVSLAVLAIGSRTSDTSLHARIRPVIQKVAAKAPFLRGIFKWVPSLSDVKPQDLADLEGARSGTPDLEVKIGFALSITDPNRPAFYVSTNLPHRTRFELLLVGESETLLNRLQFSAKNTVVSSNGLGKSEVFLMEGGQPIPKGEYTIYVYESPEQEEEIKTDLGLLPPNRGQIKIPNEAPAGVRFIVTKKYFLGGERDETYLTRLKAFHENIKEKADKELTELRQYVDTLILQNNSMNGEFQKIFKAKKVTAGIKNAWKKSSSAWVQISSQLDQAIQTWSPETLQNEFFYGKAYGLVKNAFTAMQNLFKLEMDYLEKPQDKGAFEIQHGKLLSESRDALEQLKGKMEVLLKAPKTPSGLPTREGI